MELEIDQCRKVLDNAVEDCKSEWIALSGGLDSSIPVSYTHLTLPTSDLV